MSLTVRPYEDKDLEGFKYVRQFVYNGGEPLAPEARLFWDDVFPSVAEQSGQIVAACSALDMNVTRGDAELRCAGVCAVGVPPEQRAGGIGLAFMRGVLHEYRERGFLTAALYPFRGSFYRRAGYEFGGRRTLITCPPSAMAKVEAPLRVRRLDSSEFEQIRSCYVGFASKHSGVNLRNENQWFRHLGREKPFTVYAVGDPIEGYVALRLVSGFWETQELEELVWSSSAGYLSLMSLIRSFGINQSLLSWHEPSDSPFLARFDEKGVKAESDRQIMWRAVNVPNSLRALKPDASGEVSIRVHDADLPENEGPWKARFGLEGVEVERASEADIEIDIRPFSQALMGEPSFATVLAQGRATVKTAEAAKAMNGLLPPRTTYCLDFF